MRKDGHQSRPVPDPLRPGPSRTIRGVGSGSGPRPVCYIELCRYRGGSIQTAEKRTQESPAFCCTPVSTPGISNDQAETLAQLFKALADPSRIRIVSLLANAAEPVCVCELTAPLGLSQPTVSFHLKKLLRAGLLRRERRGTWAYYSLDPDALARLAETFDQGGPR